MRFLPLVLVAFRCTRRSQHDVSRQPSPQMCCSDYLLIINFLIHKDKICVVITIFAIIFSHPLVCRKSCISSIAIFISSFFLLHNFFVNDDDRINNHNIVNILLSLKSSLPASNLWRGLLFVVLFKVDSAPFLGHPSSFWSYGSKIIHPSSTSSQRRWLDIRRIILSCPLVFIIMYFKSQPKTSAPEVSSHNSL